MPRKNIQPRPPVSSAPTSGPTAPAAAADASAGSTTSIPPGEKKWAEAYRPQVVNQEAGFEFGENKLAGRLVFSFAQDPGESVKAKLKDLGYYYDTRLKAWSVNATPRTREIAKRLAEEFAGEKSMRR